MTELRPYWWDAAPPSERCDPIPAPADVVVVGSGYTGLHAALVLARAGRSVAVLDGGLLGEGCSTRNGGQVSTSVKPSHEMLVRRHGADVADRILADGAASRAFVERFVAEEGIDCSFVTCGRFHAAHSARAFRRLEAALSATPERYRGGACVISRDEQDREIAGRAFHGGVVWPDHASLDPGRYHAGLLRCVGAAGATLHANTRALSLDEDADGVTVATMRGAIRARDVVLATNGYADALSPWFRRRIVPIGSYIIATDPLPDGLAGRLNPGGRIFSDTRRVVYYWRLSPDGRRILFGGRVAAGETDPRRAAPRLLSELVRIHPEVAGIGISHAWMGFVGYSFDSLAHLGSRGRVHHAGGYCGSGVGMASWLGRRTGLRILGKDEGGGLAEIAAPTRPFYLGRPWGLGAIVAGKRMLDRAGL